MIQDTKTQEDTKIQDAWVQYGKPDTSIVVLDGVRAIACLFVIGYHIDYVTFRDHLWTTKGLGPLLSSIALAGSSGVTLFFMLSGFLLFRPYAKSLLFDADWPLTKRYYIRRICRIWPGYYSSLLLLILLEDHKYLQLGQLPQLFFFLTFLMDSSHKTFQAINGPFWTLAVEWQFYMLLPLLALGCRWVVQRGSVQRRFFVLILCLCVMIAWGLATRYWGRYWQQHPQQSPTFLHTLVTFFVYGQDGKFLEDFAVGMCICILYVFAQRQPWHEVAQICQKYSPWIWITGCVWLFCVVAWPVTTLYPVLAAYLGAHNWLYELAYAIGFGLCMLSVLFGPARLKFLFEWGPLVQVGRLSYGMYIWHLPLLLLFHTYVVPLILHWRGYMVYGTYWIFVIAVVIPFSKLFYRLLEQPGIDFGRWLISKKM